MKSKTLAYAAAVCLLIVGIGILGFHQMRAEPEAPSHHQEHQIAAPDIDPTFSNSTGTTLVLLAVGIIGVLSVRRQKKTKRRNAHHAG